ncbi:ribbon-helix-helix protein, CopG family [Desulfobacterota bacterium AH_259_B03_O07]|nr:ribbon-helix-helix protein, CopG family [Desulfobacterota bacterium AH_259_B03_O07]
MRKRQAQIHIYLDNNVMDRLKNVAKDEGRTATELIREAAADLLKKREKQKPKKRRKK